MFAAINFRLLAPSLFHIPAGLLKNIVCVKPSLQMSAAEFSLFVFLVARTLVELLDLYFVFGKLRNLCDSCGRSGQRFDLVAGLVVPDSPADLHSTRAF